MYRIIIFLLLGCISLLLSGCDERHNNNPEMIDLATDDTYQIVIVDSCEYVARWVRGGRSICHKGNCKFCKMRKQEAIK